MSHSAMSSPLMAWTVEPARPMPCSSRSIRAVSCVSVGSWPTARCLTQASNTPFSKGRLLP